MDPKISSFASSKISLLNSICEEWDSDDSLDEISLNQEIEYDVVDKLSEEEKKPLIIDLESSCDDISNSIPSEAANESPEISLQSEQKYRRQKKTFSNSIEKYQSIEAEEKVDQNELGTCENLFVNLQEDFQQLQNQKHFNGKQSASCSSETKLKETFERCVDKHSGKVLFKCLYCQFQSIHLKDMTGHISNTHQIRSEMVQCDRRSYTQMETLERICGLCLKVCDNFKAVEGDMKDVLDVVLPNLDLGAIQELVVCTHCTEMLIKCSGFKTTCLNSYNCIVSFANYRDDVKLNLRDVYLSKNDIIAEDQAICGFCMEPIRNCSAISLDVEEKGVLLEKMMELCLPELDLSLVNKLVICAPCHDALKNCFYFVTNCLLIGEKIKKYCETQDINSRGQIQLSHLLEFTTRDVTTSEVNGGPFDIIKEEKQFWEERGNDDEGIINNGGDIFKSEQVFCSDSENDAEESKKLDSINIEETFCGENETYLKEENLSEVENHELLESKEDAEMKTDEPDFVRFEECLDLQLSEITEMNQKLYKCNYCSYKGKQKCNVKRHLLVHKSPSETTMYKCITCPFQTKRKDSFKVHLMQHLHSKNSSQMKLFSCDTCSYQSKYQSYLEKHLLKHKNPSEVTMFKCYCCLYKSKYESGLKRHLLTHKNPSEITMYKCDWCSYKSKYKGFLKKHLLTHKDPSEVTV